MFGFYIEPTIQVREKKCQGDFQVLVTQLKNTAREGAYTAFRGVCE